MKLALPDSLKLPALSCALLLPMLVGGAACGNEAAVPDAIGGRAAPGAAGTGAVLPGGANGGTTSTAGTGTTSTAGTGTTSTAGTSTGGTSGGTGNSTAGTPGGGAATAGAGGATTAGTGGASGAPAGGNPGDLKETVAGQLNGFMLIGKCLNKTAESVCQTNAGACPGGNPDAALSGILTTDKTITLGGDPAKIYTITLHVQGEVESKRYDGGMDQSSVGASPKADGFCVGGTPTGGDAYNVYMLRVTSPKKDYFFNSIQPPGASNHTTYGIDYTAKVQANGGSTIRLVAADKNCSMIRNCGPQENNGDSCAAPIKLTTMDPIAVSKNPKFNFDTEFDGQWVVMVVTDVTQG